MVQTKKQFSSKVLSTTPGGGKAHKPLFNNICLKRSTVNTSEKHAGHGVANVCSVGKHCER